MIAIIDYGMGNLASVEKALNYLGLKCIITSDHNHIKASSGIILPGVGSFEQGINNLKDKGLDQILYKEVIDNNKLFLGICLGMQLIMENGSEPRPSKGLSWIKGNVEPINNIEFPIPHLGWNNIYSQNEDMPKDNIENNFYFIHSFHVVPLENVEKQWVNYEFPMVASLKKGNIHATQFHPEKSQSAGLEYLKKIFQDYA